ncbi:MAG: ATP-binding protein [Defluviicoccus sp.]|nr:ATP-binding protein [Defluviicoccus sp.]
MTTEEALTAELSGLLRLDPDAPKRLASRENSRLEYKESFNWANRAKYGKTLAAFANASGGFIVFGVQDSPRLLLGVNDEIFDAIDLARFSAYLNSAYAPELEWELFSTHFGGVRLGVLYVALAKERPVVSLKDDREGIRESDIYYRYRARSQRIRYPELQSLLLERQHRERDSWLDHLSRVGRIGVENVGVLDLVEGELSGRGGRLLVSSDLLEKVQFIRKGRFAQSGQPGAPTLRLVGDVEAVAPNSLAPVRTVARPLVIGEREILLAFLRQERPQAPIEYIRQACRETSLYMPIYHFAHSANLGIGELRDLISGEPRRRNAIHKRVEGARVSPVGTLNAMTPQAIQRREILEALAQDDVDALRPRDRVRLFEAITHFVPTATPAALLELLAELVQDEFDEASSNVRSICRKSVAHLDEAMNYAAVRDAQNPGIGS